jgi:hypothetical protein
MKNTIYLICLALFLVNCSPSDDSEIIEIIVEEVMEVTTPQISFKGDFVSAAHPTSGMVSVNDKKTEIYFKGFKTDNGPKLLVYLSSDVNATEYVNLGDLKGISGDYTYAIPANTALNKFKFVNIWCVDFLVSFGHAELKSE